VYEGDEPGSPIRALLRYRNAQTEHRHLRGKLARFVLVEKRADRVARLLAELRALLDDPMLNGEGLRSPKRFPEAASLSRWTDAD